MTRVAYRYIGPEEIRLRSLGTAPGAAIQTAADLAVFVAKHPAAVTEGATFVVTLDGLLRLAPRRSEHVACASGEPVLTAGELTFCPLGRGRFAIDGATNQSTGYCPEPDSFEHLARALRRAGLDAPSRFAHAFVFRRCERCQLLNLVKDDDFTCAACAHELPRERNL